MNEAALLPTASEFSMRSSATGSTARRQSRPWVIGLTVLVTSLTLVFLQNFKSPEKVVERKVEHRYAVT
jgi:high-affinity K+ transport system ATPase subunit B